MTLAQKSAEMFQGAQRGMKRAMLEVKVSPFFLEVAYFAMYNINLFCVTEPEYMSPRRAGDMNSNVHTYC